EVAHADGVADGELPDVDLDGRRDVAGGGAHGDGEHRLVDHAVLTVDLQGLAHEGDGDVGADDLVAADDDEVDVHDRVAHRVALELAGHGEVLGAVELELEKGVEARVGGEGVAQGPPLDRQRRGARAVPVEDPGDLPGGAQPPRSR